MTSKLQEWHDLCQAMGVDESGFRPDWSRLDACRDSLREHMVMVRAKDRVISDLFAALENMVEWHCLRGNTDEDPILEYEQQPHEVRQAMDALAKARAEGAE